MAVANPSVSGVLPEPICLICGVSIETTDQLGMPSEYSRFQGKEKYWRRLWESDSEHLVVLSPEAENIYIDRFPRLWGCLYRASTFFKDCGFVTNIEDLIRGLVLQESRTKFRLTGISSVTSMQGPYYAVNDPEKARISGKKNPQYESKPGMFTQFFPAHLKRQPQRYKGETIGFMIHAQCWVILSRMKWLGFQDNTSISSSKLHKLIKVCRKHWWNSDLWGLPFFPDSIMWPEYQSSLQCSLDVTQGPLIVPAIQQAIDSAKTEYYHPTEPSILGILPLELKILIAEKICPITEYTASDVENLRNMLFASGWELPVWFWRMRLDESLFFELKIPSKDPSTDWKLRVNLMSIVADRSRLASLVNRERVLEIILALKEAYVIMEKKKG